MRCPNPAKTVAENEIALTIDCLDNQSNQNARPAQTKQKPSQKTRLPRQSIKPERKAPDKGISTSSMPGPGKDSRKTRLPRRSMKPERKALPKEIPRKSMPRPSKDRRRKQNCLDNQLSQNARRCLRGLR